MTPEQSWYVTLSGREHGPLDGAAVRALVARGKIIANTPVRRGDLQQAVPAGRIKGMLPATAATPAPAAISISTSRLTPLPIPVEEPEPMEEPTDDGVPEGRAGIHLRLVSLLIDASLIGGGAVILLILALRGMPQALEGTLSRIEASRAKQTEEMNGKGEARSTFAGWPTLRATWEADLAAKKLAVATAEKELPPAPPKGQEPTQADAAATVAFANLKNEVDYREKTLDYEIKRYTADQEAIRVAGENAGRTALIMTGAAAALVLLLAPLLEGLFAATPGKLLLRLRTVGADRTAIGFGAALLRQACRLVPGAHLGLFQGGDLLAWHDRWSRSEVVASTAVARRTRGKATTRAQKAPAKPSEKAETKAMAKPGTRTATRPGTTGRPRRR